MTCTVSTARQGLRLLRGPNSGPRQLASNDHGGFVPNVLGACHLTSVPGRDGSGAQFHMQVAKLKTRGDAESTKKLAEMAPQFLQVSAAVMDRARKDGGRTRGRSCQRDPCKIREQIGGRFAVQRKSFNTPQTKRQRATTDHVEIQNSTARLKKTRHHRDHCQNRKRKQRHGKRNTSANRD